jgi:hypothetical protein
VHSAAGESSKRSLRIPAEKLGWYDSDGSLQQDRGTHTFWVANGADPRAGSQLVINVT